MKSGIRRYPAALAMALAAALGGPAIPSRLVEPVAPAMIPLPRKGKGKGGRSVALGWRDRYKWPAGYRHPQTREKARRLRQMARAAAKQPVELADAA